MFKVYKNQFEQFDDIIFEETKVKVIQKLVGMREITREEANKLFEDYRKHIKAFGLETEASILRFLLLVIEFNVTVEDLNNTKVKEIFSYPDREEELKIDKFHEHLIDLHDSEF